MVFLTLLVKNKSDIHEEFIPWMLSPQARPPRVWGRFLPAAGYAAIAQRMGVYSDYNTLIVTSSMEG